MKRLLLAAVALAAAAAPGTASAASIEVGANGIVYRAAAGEENALRMSGTVGGGADLRMAFFEFEARLKAGPGCVAGFPVICGDPFQAFPVDVSLGDDTDVANVNSFTGTMTLDAGSGTDDVLAGGIDVTAEGGSGSDTVRLAANNLATGSGGSGHDRMSAGLGAAAAILDGGSGNDLLVPGGFIFNDAKGGADDDRLVSFTGNQTTLSGQSGDDVVVAAGGSGSIALDGGSGNDILAGEVGGVTVSGGSGKDVIDVRGPAGTAPDTVSCGSGWDVVFANREDVVAADCEVELSYNPTLSKVTDAVAAAQALLAHTPDPGES